jgi:uncharacterized protein (DUF1330 family)
MPAYLIAAHQITDTVKFQEYGRKVVPMIAKYGGRILTGCVANFSVMTGWHEVVRSRGDVSCSKAVTSIVQ